MIEWSPCTDAAFAVYKIVRSGDSSVTWPAGDGDKVVGAVESQEAGRFVDRTVSAGRAYHYRVFGLAKDGNRVFVACQTGVKKIATPPAEPGPDPSKLSMTGVIKEGHPFLDWAACEGLDFDYYKLVRSKDATVSWPLGDNDSLAAVVGRDGETKAWDAEAPGGRKLFYRVYCVRSTEAGYVVLAASNVVSVETPAAEPAPEPVALGFEVDVTGEGVVLHWEACTSDAFHYYKVVRSLTNEHPSYLPPADGTELIAVIENPGVTGFTDTAVESGQTIYYRVQSIGIWNGEKVLLGQTAVIAVTIP